MKTLVFAALFALSIVTADLREAEGQFTQGPPENPSAAGIITGTQPPAAAPPRPVMPPALPPATYMPAPYPPVLPRTGSDTCPAGAGMIVSPHWFLSPQVMPAALDTDMAALARHLNLSPSQVDGITEVRNRFYRETRDLRYGLLEKRMELRKLLSDPKTDERLLLKRQREVSDLWQKLADMVGRAVIEARRLLNPEQIERLDQLPL